MYTLYIYMFHPDLSDSDLHLNVNITSASKHQQLLSKHLDLTMCQSAGGGSHGLLDWQGRPLEQLVTMVLPL